MPEIKLGPETLQEEDLGVLVTLPEHKIAKSLDAARPDEKIKRRTTCSIHMVCDCLGRYRLGVGVYSDVRCGPTFQQRGVGVQRGR